MSLLTRQKSRPAPVDRSARAGAADGPGERRRHAPIATNARSCCCPSEPAVQVILTLPDGRSATGGTSAETDLLLCAHHLRESAAALGAAGAQVYDRGGDPIDDLTSVFVQDRRDVPALAEA
jgi:hypothetical protein